MFSRCKSLPAGTHRTGLPSRPLAVRYPTVLHRALKVRLCVTAVVCAANVVCGLIGYCVSCCCCLLIYAINLLSDRIESVSPPPISLPALFGEVNSSTPLLLISSPGADASKELQVGAPFEHRCAVDTHVQIEYCIAVFLFTIMNF